VPKSQKKKMRSTEIKQKNDAKLNGHGAADLRVHCLVQDTAHVGG